MISIEPIITVVNSFFASYPVLLTIFSTSLLFKSFLLFNIIFKKENSEKTRVTYFLIISLLIGTIICDSEWVFMLIKKMFLNDAPLKLFVFWRRIAWACTVGVYQLFALLLESLTNPQKPFSTRNKLFSIISFCFFSFFIAISIIHYNCLGPAEKYWIEFEMQSIGIVFILFPLMGITVLYTLWQLKNLSLPRIILKQLRLLMIFIVIPYWLSDLLQMAPFSFTMNWINTSYAFVGLSNILLNIALIYCSRRMLGLRFLNWSRQVHSPMNINFMENFKITLEQFSHVTTTAELVHITQRFFKEAFDIPFNRVQLHMRLLNQQGLPKEGPMITIVENFLSTQKESTAIFIKNQKLLVYDDLAFSNFYEANEDGDKSLAFLDAIQADIFLPIYEKKKLVAYIIVDRHARFNRFYTGTECDEMLIFTRYLNNIINLMQNKNLDTFIQKEKVLQEELYAKHQEIRQYKESIRSFLRKNNHKDIGIIFYKNRRFTFGNKAAKILIPFNPNLQEGHPLCKTLKNVAQQVESYKSAQIAYAKDTQGSKLVLSGVPGLDNNNVIISVYYPEVTDVIKKEIDILKDPSEWDYLLYLETTKPGQLINQLIPGSGETLLNFKIELLKTALSKKATLLDMPEQDLQQTVEILHHISVRETLRTIDLNGPVTNYDVAMHLFGINSLFDPEKKGTKSLLETLDNTGTLFIKNIHYLDLETQEYLAEFIRYGFFRIFKSDTKIASNVRIICSTNQNLHHLVSQDKFSKALFSELKKATLSMPSLAMLPENELNTLSEGFSEQATTNKSFESILSLSTHDKLKLFHQQPTSLKELKAKIKQILIAKSKRNDVYNESFFDPGYAVSDPELIEAARLGKKALKDQKTMMLLWHKFKNQNKIADFLGVNRSSVSRRYKQYNITE